MKKNNFNSFLLLFVFLTLSGCKDDDNEDKVPTECTNVSWGYVKGSDSGPENWDMLCTGFADCAGQKQSPIDIKGAVANPDLKPIELMYSVSKTKIKNTGKGIKFELKDTNNKAKIQGEEYKLLQFHYHSKSEHTIDGNYAPLEVHFVHQNVNDENKYAVIGAMIKEGEENKLLTDYLAVLPKESGQEISSEDIDIDALLPFYLSYYNYSGSLTTPPCGEVVNWHVLKTYLTASKEQIEKFSEILGVTNRPIQPVNGRTIYEYNEKLK